MCIAGCDEDHVGLERHAVLGNDRRTARHGTKLARKHPHERYRQMLGDEDRHADLLRQGMEQRTERMNTPGRSANREHVNRIARHGAQPAGCTLLNRGRRGFDRGIAKRLQLPEQDLGELTVEASCAWLRQGVGRA